MYKTDFSFYMSKQFLLNLLLEENQRPVLPRELWHGHDTFSMNSTLQPSFKELLTLIFNIQFCFLKY